MDRGIILTHQFFESLIYKAHQYLDSLGIIEGTPKQSEIIYFQKVKSNIIENSQCVSIIAFRKNDSNELKSPLNISNSSLLRKRKEKDPNRLDNSKEFCSPHNRNVFFCKNNDTLNELDMTFFEEEGQQTTMSSTSSKNNSTELKLMD